MIDEYESDDLDDEVYYQQIEEYEWIEYVDVCLDCGCSECGHKMEDAFEIVDYHSYVYCEGNL